MIHKSRLLFIVLLPFIFILGGCSHISKIQVRPHSQAEIQINGKSHKDRIYYKYGKIKSTKVTEGTFEIDVPRSDKNQTVLVSGNKNLSSAKRVTIPASKPLCSWEDFVGEFNDAELKSNGENNGPKIPNHLAGKSSGCYTAIIRNEKLTFWLSNGNIMAVRIKGDYPINKFKYMVGIATSASGPIYSLGEDAAQKLAVTDKPIKVINGSLQDGYHYHASNIYGKLTFDIFRY